MDHKKQWKYHKNKEINVTSNVWACQRHAAVPRLLSLRRHLGKLNKKNNFFNFFTIFKCQNYKYLIHFLNARIFSL